MPAVLGLLTQCLDYRTLIIFPFRRDEPGGPLSTCRRGVQYPYVYQTGTGMVGTGTWVGR